MARKKRKVNSLIQGVVEDMPTSGPSPDEELTIVGRSMCWSPVTPNPVKIKENDIQSEDDKMLNIL